MNIDEKVKAAINTKPVDSTRKMENEKEQNYSTSSAHSLSDNNSGSSGPGDGVLSDASFEKKKTPNSKRERNSTSLQKQPYDCENCGKALKNSKTLRIHIKRVHHGEKNFECAYCDAKYYYKYLLINHLRLHQFNDEIEMDIEATKKHECELCGNFFRNTSDLNQHIQTHTGEKSYECFHCNAKYAWKSTLVKHMKLHQEQPTTDSNKPNIDSAEVVALAESEKKFQCKECDKKFKVLYTLVRHRRRHAILKKSFPQTNSNESLECIHCNLQFTNNVRLLKHLKIHVKRDVKKPDPRNFTPEAEKKFKCEICDKKFVKIFNLKLHRITHTDEHQFSCSQCDRKFRARASLTHHIETYHPNFALEEINRKIINKKSKRESRRKINTGERRFKCPTCEKAYTRKDNLTTHSKICNGNQTVRKYKCEFCDKEYFTSKSIRRHLKTHNGENPYNCSQCFMKMANKEELDVHFTIHKPNHKEMEVSDIIHPQKTVANFNVKRKHQCEICSKIFTRLSSLKRHHLFIHERGQPFFCSQCPLKYLRKETFDKHVRNHEQNKLSGSIGSESTNAVSNKIARKYKCEFCNKKYLQSNNLRLHLEKHKGENPYNCSKCFMKMANKEELDVHFTIHEPNHKEMEVFETILPKKTKTTDIGIESSINLQENLTVKSENTNVEQIELATIGKIEEEEPDVIETQSTAPPSNNCYDEAICKEELILFD